MNCKNNLVKAFKEDFYPHLTFCLFVIRVILGMLEIIRSYRLGQEKGELAKGGSYDKQI